VVRGAIVLAPEGGEVTAAGARLLTEFGVELAPPVSRRIFCRPCLDWSERRYHVAGHVGAEICRCCLERGWLERRRDTRTLRLTPAGAIGLSEAFGVADAAGAGSPARAEIIASSGPGPAPGAPAATASPSRIEN
jgi:hypothetical protein